MNKCMTSSRLFLLAVIFLGFCFSNNLAFGNEEVDAMLEKGKSLYQSKNYDDAMDYFIDASVRGTPQQMSEANDYINRIHVHMADSYSANQDIYRREAQLDSEMRTAMKEESAIEVREREIRGESQINTIDPNSEDPDIVAQRKQFQEMQMDQKVKDLTNAALLKLSETPGIEFYMRKDLSGRVDAIDIATEVLFDTKSKNFKANIGEVLQSIYILMLVNKDAIFTILPEDAYNGQVSIESMRYSTKLYSYFFDRGISPAKLFLNMGLDSSEIPAKFANLDGIAIVFDYDVAPKLKYRKEDKLEPLISLGLYPEESIVPELGELFIIDFSVLETKYPIANWELQIIRNEGPNIFYTVRQLKGNDRVYHQIRWTGRKTFFGEILPLGEYNILLKAVDSQGNKKVVKRKISLLDKQGGAKRVKVYGKTIIGGEITTTGYSKTKVTSMSDVRNYRVNRLWNKPERIMLKKPEPVVEEEVVEEIIAEEVIVEEKPVVEEPVSSTPTTTSTPEPAPATPESDLLEDELEGDDLY